MPATPCLSPSRRAPRAARAATLARAAAAALAAAFGIAPACPALAQPVSTLATDGYFDVERIDAVTFAIHEPHYWQKNVMYVLKGEQRAILIDTGSGTKDLAFIADKVTKKPMTAVATHLHYDHIGSHASFQQVAMIDLPETRAATHDNWYSPPLLTSLWPATRGFAVTEWWKPGDSIDIGGRRIDVVHLPGHSTNEIAIVDRKNGYAFVGDHLYGGPLLANLPGSDLVAYQRSTRKLLDDFPEIRTVFGGHEPNRLPREALVALDHALTAIIDRKAAGHRLWWLAWMTARYPGDGFSIFAAPQAGPVLAAPQAGPVLAAP